LAPDLGEENEMQKHDSCSDKRPCDYVVYLKDTSIWDENQLKADMPFTSAMVVSINASERGQSDRRQGNDHQQEID
jgi:hypothetical protein